MANPSTRTEIIDVLTKTECPITGSNAWEAIWGFLGDWDVKGLYVELYSVKEYIDSAWDFLRENAFTTLTYPDGTQVIFKGQEAIANVGEFVYFFRIEQ